MFRCVNHNFIKRLIKGYAKINYVGTVYLTVQRLVNLPQYLAIVILFFFVVHLPAQTVKNTVSLNIGESKTVRVDYNLDKIAIGDPEIADVLLTGTREVLVNAKSSGSTTLLTWGKEGEKDTFYVQVSRTLSPQPLIQLNVQVVEVKLSSLKRLGISWPDMASFGEINIPGIFTLGTLDRFNKIMVDLNYLVKDGHARVLANPNLVAMSGSNASFHVGGEIPYLVSQGLGQNSVEWKQYGIKLDISPVGDEKKKIIVTGIRTQVSTLDYANAVRTGGVAIPALTTRQAQTEVQVPAGSVVVIAGLKQNVETANEQGLPLIMKIPLLGYLFKTRDSLREETEITVFVTPNFVTPTK